MEPRFKCNNCKINLEIWEIHYLPGEDVTDDRSFGMPYGTGRKLCQECFNKFTHVEKNDESSPEVEEKLEEEEKIDPELKERKNLELFNELKKWRYGVAREKNLPAYCILNDETLRKIMIIKPKTALDLKNIDGIGSVKLKQYGKDILNIVNDY